MIEGVMRHGTSMNVEGNYVDSHGQSEVGFGITRLLGFDLPPADVHREFVNLRTLGDGEKIRALETLRVRVVKLLIHRRGGDLSVNLHIHVVKRHLQRRESIRPWCGRPRVGRSRAGPPIRFLHDDKPVRATLRRGCNQTGPDQQSQKDENTFHGWLDGSGGKMLPINDA